MRGYANVQIKQRHEDLKKFEIAQIGKTAVDCCPSSVGLHY